MQNQALESLCLVKGVEIVKYFEFDFYLFVDYSMNPEIFLVSTGGMCALRVSSCNRRHKNRQLRIF